MSRLIKKVVPTERERNIHILKKNCRFYKRKLGRIRYVVIFLLSPRIHDKKQGFFITDKEWNGIPEGYYNSVIESEVGGTLIDVGEMPDNIIKMVADEVRYGS